MDNCKKVKDKLSLYIDGELEEDKQKEIRKHIDECFDCREEYIELKNIIDFCRDLDEDVPEGFMESLHEKLLEVKNESVKEVSSKRFYESYRYLKIISSIAAIAIVLFITKTVLDNSIYTYQAPQNESFVSKSSNIENNKISNTQQDNKNTEKKDGNTLKANNTPKAENKQKTESVSKIENTPKAQNIPKIKNTPKAEKVQKDETNITPIAQKDNKEKPYETPTPDEDKTKLMMTAEVEENENLYQKSIHATPRESYTSGSTVNNEIYAYDAVLNTQKLDEVLIEFKKEVVYLNLEIISEELIKDEKNSFLNGVQVVLNVRRIDLPKVLVILLNKYKFKITKNDDESKNTEFVICNVKIYKK